MLSWKPPLAATRLLMRSRLYAPVLRSLSSPAQPPAKRGWVQAIKEGAHHYWVGSKLLATDISVSYRLIRRITRGHALSRRERRLLTRTFVDLLRLVPFSVFVIVPFLEFTLPFVLKLFPNMLPSTFADKHKQAEDQKKLLKVRLEVAAFQQEMLEEMLKARPGAEQLKDVLSKLKAGEQLDNDLIRELSKHFSNELTMENISHEQLVQMCRYMGVPTYYPDTILRYQLQQKLSSIRNDDEMIQREGVSSLSVPELKVALRERGMRAIGVSVNTMRKNLSDWIDLSLKENIPPSLLVLSRALNLARKEELSMNAIQDTIAKLEPEFLNEVMLESGVRDNEIILESVQRQKQKIEQEEKEKRSAPVVEHTVADDEDVLDGILKAISVCASESAVAEEKQRLTDLMSKLENQSLTELIATMSPFEDETKRKIRAAFLKHRPELAELYPDEMQPKAEETKPTPPPEDKVEQALRKSLKKMIESIESDIQSAEVSIGDKLKLLDRDEDGLITFTEIRRWLVDEMKATVSEEEIIQIFDKLDLKRDGVLDLEEVKQLRHLLEDLQARKKSEDLASASIKESISSEKRISASEINRS